MGLSRTEIRDATHCPTCGAEIGKPCRHTGAGAAKKRHMGVNHHSRQVAAQAPPDLALPSGTVITDASRCSETGAGGWAAWVRVDSFDVARKASGPLRMQTSHPSEAEMMAALNGIFLARSMGASAILLQTDCLLVVDLICGKIRKRGPIGVWKGLLKESGVDLRGVSSRHVKGHTKNEGARYHANRWCDLEARRHMRATRKQMRDEMLGNVLK